VITTERTSAPRSQPDAEPYHPAVLFFLTTVGRITPELIKTEANERQPVSFRRFTPLHAVVRICDRGITRTFRTDPRRYGDIKFGYLRLSWRAARSIEVASSSQSVRAGGNHADHFSAAAPVDEPAQQQSSSNRPSTIPKSSPHGNLRRVIERARSRRVSHRFAAVAI